MESETEPRELSAEFVFAVPVSSMLGFLSLPRAGFFPHSASPTGAFAKLGFCCAWLPPCGGRAEIVSARLNPSHGTIYVRGVCNFLGSVSLQQKFEATDGPVLQLSFIWQAKKIHPRGVKAD